MIPSRNVIAIIGGIGSGKSTVCAILAQLGYRIIDCDIIAKQVASQPDVLHDISVTFGENLVNDGRLDRRALRQKVFADSTLLDALNGIFFQRITTKLAEELKSIDEKTVFVEVSAYKNELATLFTDMWLITAQDNARVKRAAQRDGIEEASVRETISRQNSDYIFSTIIDNNGTIAQLKRRIKQILQEKAL